MNIQNKKAYYDYNILDKYVAGIILTGTEIKSIRQGKASLIDTFCTVENDGVWMRNSYVAKYDEGSYNNHEERRNRKLLLTKTEQNKLLKHAMVQGNTIVPLKMFIDNRGFCKVEIGLAKGKKDYDKRESIKEKDLKRELERYKTA